MNQIDWMKTSVGVSVHWTSHSGAQDGSRASYEEGVNAFDAARFVETLKKAGAKHLIFTLTHAEQYLAYPCAPLEHLLSGRTTRRDLLGELAARLDEAGIRLIAYYNHSCNGHDDPPWRRACGYENGDMDRFAGNICAVVGDVARHLGSLLHGWWFDSASSIDPRGPRNTVSCPMGDWRFPWDRLVSAARAGNPQCAISINAGVGLNFTYTPAQNFCAGESVQLDERFNPPAPGMVDHRWITLDNPEWVYAADGPAPFRPLRFSDDDVAAFIRRNRQNGRMTTFNMEVDRAGLINPQTMAQFRRVLSAIQ